MKPTKPLRFLHVSTRYGLRVVSVRPYVTEFVAKELSGKKLPRRWSDSVHPGPNKVPGVTYRRAESKAKRPGRVRRTMLTRARLMQEAYLARKAALAAISP